MDRVHIIDQAASDRIKPARGIIQGLLSVLILEPQLVPNGFLIGMTLAKPRLPD